MIKPAILIDIDDTLADTQTRILAYVNIHANRAYQVDNITRVFREGGDPEIAEYEKLVSEFLMSPELVAEIKPFPGALDAVRSLHDAGFAVHVASARKENLHSVTLEWLDEHGFTPYLQETHGRMSTDRGAAFKLGIAESIEALAAFDDTYDVALTLTDAGIPVYMMEKPWNHEEELLEGMVLCDDFVSAVSMFLSDIEDLA